MTSDDEEFSVPYSGPPYSLYNAEYWHIVNTTSAVQPQLSYKFGDTYEVITELREVSSSSPYRSLIGRDQYTRGYRSESF